MEGIPKTEDNMKSQSSSPSENPDPSSPRPIALEQQIEENHLSQLMFQVFNEELLREKIIDYVIHDGKQLSLRDIQISRLVQNSWLITVSKLLRKQRTPLFYFKLNNDNSLQESAFVQQNGKLLDQFLNTSLRNTSPSFVDDHIPPFAIKASQGFFKKENYNSFRDILLKCGNALVEMELEIPHNGGSMLFVFPMSRQLSLPIFTRFTVDFAEEFNHDGSDRGNNGSSIYLLELILSAAHNSLKQLTMPFTLEDAIPTGLEYLTLPVSMTTLDLSCQMNSEDLKILLQNSLPNLKKLEIRIPARRFDDGLISQILKKFCKTLEYVCFWSGFHDGTSKPPTYFKLPFVIENLQQFTIRSTHLELENNLCSLESSLPEMKSLYLRHQTIPMFRKWTYNSKFENVTELLMTLADANFDERHENYYVNIDAEIMQSLHLAFPNLKTLDITLCGAEMSGLEYLLLEMKQLEYLEIRVRRTENLVNSDLWDSVLTGVTVELATAMRTIPDFLECFEIKNSPRPSIRSLSNLKFFKIITEGSTPSLANVALISDSVFHFGFFKLPNLLELVLGGRFLVSNEIREKWKVLKGEEVVYKDENAD